VVTIIARRFEPHDVTDADFDFVLVQQAAAARDRNRIRAMDSDFENATLGKQEARQ
jgi:hypothetical protein